MPERIVREIEVLIPAILHLIRDGWTITTLSPVPHRDAELRCQDRQRVEAALREAGVDPGAITFVRQGPDIVAERDQTVWRVECKGAGNGKRSTQRNNFDRALGSTVSCFKPPPEGWTLRLGLAVPDHPDYLTNLRERVSKLLRTTLNLWVLLVTEHGIEMTRPADEGQWGSPGRRRRAPYWKALGLDR